MDGEREFTFGQISRIIASPPAIILIITNISQNKIKFIIYIFQECLRKFSNSYYGVN